MARSHVCLACGHDLARIRAAPEPEYGWWIVRCPVCATVAVRRPHPAGRLLRWLIRLDAAVTGLVLRGIAGFVLAMTTAAVIQDGTRHLLGAQPLSGRPIEDLALLASAPILWGAWIRLSLHHWGIRRAWMAAILVPACIHVLFAASFPTTPMTLGSLPDRLWRTAQSISPEGIFGFGTSAALLPLMLTGGIIGSVLARVGAAARRARFRWYRRAARRGRFIPG
jgi:hypothetical protein